MKTNKKLLENLINENKNILEEKKLLNDKLDVKIDLNNFDIYNDLFEKALKTLVKIKLK